MKRFPILLALMRPIGVFAALGLALSACVPLAGSNTGVQTSGNRAGGAALGLTLSVSQGGHYLVTQMPGADGRNTTWSVDLRTLGATRLDVPSGASRMVFGPAGVAYLLVQSASNQHGRAGGPSRIEAISLATGQIEATWRLGGVASALSIEAADGRLAAWYSADKAFDITSPDQLAIPSATDPRTVTIIDPATDSVQQHLFDHPVVDARWVPSTGALAVVTRVAYRQSRVSLLKAPAYIPTTIDIPNCAAGLRISPKGDIAMLAPSSCAKDPVSVIDLVHARFVKNLPGFGPVTFSPDGKYAVAFARKAGLAAVGVHVAAAYSLMFIDTNSLTFQVLELGSDLPIYTVTPTGQVVLLYAIIHGASYDGVRIVDVDSRTIRTVSGPEVALDDFVMTPDGRMVYLIDGGLFRLNIETGILAYVALPCRTPGAPSLCHPNLINLLPNGKTLVLGYTGANEVSLYDLGTRTLTATLELDPNQGGRPRPVAAN